MGTMTIDGRKVEFTDEKNVLTVIRNAGIDIPTLCYHSEVRPPSIEQLCFSFAASFGPLRRQEVGEVIVAELGSPIDYEWSNEDFMKRHRSNVLAASNELIRRCIPKQKPLVLIGEWRTQGQEPVLDNECYDVFFFPTPRSFSSSLLQ